MIRIRREQMEALAHNRLDDFKKRLGKFLAAAAPELSADAIEAAAARTLIEAKAYGLVTEAEYARFGEITVRRLGGFPEGRLPVAALAILMSYGVAPAVKLDRYEAWANGRV